MTPSEHAVLRGVTVKFSCTSANPVVWKFRNGLLKRNMQTYKTQSDVYWLKIMNVQPEHEGLYTCTTEKDMVLLVGEGQLSITRT